MGLPPKILPGQASAYQKAVMIPLDTTLIDIVLLDLIGMPR